MPKGEGSNQHRVYTRTNQNQIHSGYGRNNMSSSLLVFKIFNFLQVFTLLVNFHSTNAVCDNFDNSDNSTCVQSVECTEGSTYSFNGTCVQCTECLSGFEVTACNQTHDAVCADKHKCEREFYWNHRSNRCEHCRLCPHGFGALIPCSSTNDAVCLQCPFGYFSDVLSSRAECVPCGVCKSEQLLTHNCTSIQDTICNDKKNLFVRKLSPQSEISQENFISFGEGLLPLYCTLLSAVIFGLILYVLIKKWLLSRHHHKLPVFDEHQQLHCNLLLQAKLYNAPKCKRIQVEKLLNPYRSDKRDWTALARQFGYTSIQITHLQKFRAAQGGCTRELLAQLDKNGVSVDEFVRVSLLIGRGDVASVFRPHLIKSIGRDLNRQFI